jgi:enoyl-CoA hydratase
MSPAPMRVERADDIAIWTLARPEVKNALNDATFAALEHTIAAAASDGALRAVVLTGEGDTFVSGGDLRELQASTSRTQASDLAAAGRRVCDGIARLQVPVIAALPGPAIGGGAELAVACDMRVADPRAVLSFKHARMAVTTAWGVLPKLVEMVGHGAAARLLLAGHEVRALEAQRLGLVDAVSKRGACVPMAIAWARDVARGAPLAVTELKMLLFEALGAKDNHLVREHDAFAATWASLDHGEAVEAFFARRAPKWRGR